MNADTETPRTIDPETRNLCQTLTDRYGTIYGVFLEKGTPYLEPAKPKKTYLWKTRRKRK